MTSVPLQQKDLFTRRWRKQLEPQKEVTLHIQLVAVLRWALRPDVIMRHVPNGEERTLRTAQKLKAMGVLPGSADLEFHWCEVDIGKHRKLLHLELKVANRKMSEAQAGFALAMKLLGDEYLVAKSIDEAITILGERGLLRPDVTVGGRRWP
jgi:hypothetical protein